VRRLDPARAARLTLVSGPPGSGKTTGVAQWARNAGAAVVWLDASPGDADPGEWRRQILRSLGPRTAGVGDDGIAGAFADISTETILVCDDIERLSDARMVGELDDLCCNGPGQLHVVLVGRSAPSLPSLMRIRLAGEVHELDPEDLRCRDEEAADMLTALGVDADATERESLLARTEGLIAAVALAGVLGKRRDDVRSLAEFGGDTPELAQYLYSEVIDSLTIDVFGFMLATSVLDVLEPAACNDITGRTDARALLTDLARRNVLTETIDHGRAFRYHRLLRDFLRTEFARTRPDRWSALHRSAAAYYEREGDEDRALHHWIEAGETEKAWNRFGRRSLPRFFEGGVTAVTQWTEMLGRPRHGHIDVEHGLDMALTLIYTGDVDAALEWCATVDDALAAGTDDPDTHAPRVYLQFLFDFANGDFIKAARQARRAKELLPGSRWSWDELRAPCAHALLQSLMGRNLRARATLDAFIERSDPHRATDKVAVGGVLAHIALGEGKLAEADDFANEAIDAAVQVPEPDFWFTLTPRYVRGVVALERNRLDAARDDLERTCALGARQGFIHVLLPPLLALARVRNLFGDEMGTRAALESARRLLRRSDAPWYAQAVDEQDALLAVRTGHHEAARALADKLHEPAHSHVLARLAAASGAEEELRSALGRLSERTLRDHIEWLLLRARVAREEQQLDIVRRALTLGEPDGYVRVFVDEATWLQPLVRHLVASWQSGFAAAVSAAMLAEPDRQPSARNLSGLSDREQEVWRFLSTALSMQDIADALFVSRNTLKSHVRSIYRKLNVSTRQAAVAMGHGNGSAS
jgi:LuxR family transcriptional regulator, maltose regulon positive regulatory protein